MYPEVEQYMTTFRNAERAYEDAITEADNAWTKSYRTIQRAAEDAGDTFDRYNNRAHAQAIREIDAVRDAAYTEARQAKRSSDREHRALLLDSEHKDVAWIAEHCLFAGQGGEVEGHARTILKALPASTDELWRLAKDDHSMCEVFDRFFDEAEAAGVFNDGKRPTAYREIAALRNYIRRNYGHSYVRTFMEKLDRITAVYKEAAAADMAMARAEWQRMDEAYAEQTHRNRSEGARRAAETRRANREQTERVSLVKVYETEADAPPFKSETVGVA